MPTKEKTRDNCSTNNISCLSLAYILSLVLIYEKEVSKLLTKSRYLSDLLNTTINVLRTVELYEHL